jgi:hypothetical protein
MNLADWRLIDILVDHAFDLDEGSLNGASLSRIQAHVKLKITELSEVRPVSTPTPDTHRSHWDSSDCPYADDYADRWASSDDCY